MDSTTTVAAIPAPPAPAPVQQPHRGSRLKFIGSFITWIFTGFGLFRKETIDECRLIVVPNHFYLWVLAAVCGIGALSSYQWPGSTPFFTWTLLIAGLYTAILFIGELHFWRLTFWAGVVGLIYLILRYPLGWLGITPGLSRWIGHRHPIINSDAMLLLTIVFGGFLIGALAQAFASGRKRMLPNAIEEWHFGRGADTMDKGGLQFKTNYPDILEMIFGFGAGDLLAYDRAGRVVKRYENVLFLFFRWNKLDRILHSRFAEVDNVPGYAVETHDVQVGHDVHDVHDAADQNQAL